MTKDYARYHSPQKNSAPLLKWSLILSPFAIVAGAFVWLYFNPAASHQLAESIEVWKQKVSQVLSPKKTNVLAEATSKEREPFNDNIIHFEFYSSLPKMDTKALMVQNEPPVTTELPPALPQNTSKEHYALQFAVFKDPIAASKFRVSLLLAGIEAEVVKQSSGKEVTYRIQHGRYPDIKLAVAAKKTLERKGFTSLVKRES